jgi:DHA2 family multidrug resistance protein
MTDGYPPPAIRRLITFFVMSAAIMNQLDTTIANVALPHMQGSTSASREQITWVLTSYIVAAAIFTPLTGWLANRFGRKRLLLLSIVGFTITSGLCGMAMNLDQLIAFRILQGVFGSSLVPMSQATILDINPKEKHGEAMAIFGLAAITGPLLGPLLGGWLTDHFSWRWVFLINLPFGVCGFIGLSAFMSEVRHDAAAKLDLFGFGLLAVAMGAFQLMLDRGQMLDWFQSTEIWAEAVIAAMALYLFAAHSFTAKNPFISPAVFADRNFIISSAIGFFLGILIYSPLSLLPPMLSELKGYPIMTIGMVTAPRGIGTLFAMLFVGRVINRMDLRILVGVGLLLCGISSFLLSRMSLESDALLVLMSGVVQGVGSSIIFVPLSTMAFATLPVRYRNEGAALNTLIRNFGATVGISLVQTITIRNTEIVHSRLVEGLRPDNPTFDFALPDFDFGLPQAVAQLDHEVVRQAMMVSYVDTFWALFVVGAVAAPLVLLLRSPK